MNLQLIIVITIFLSSCVSHDTQRKVSTQLSGKNSSTKNVKNLSSKSSDSKNKEVKKIDPIEKKIANESSFEEYVNVLLKNNKSKGFPDINSIRN